jgi:hypothetical protein
VARQGRRPEPERPQERPDGLLDAARDDRSVGFAEAQEGPKLVVADEHAKELLGGRAWIVDGQPPALGLVLEIGGKLRDDAGWSRLVDRPAELREARRLADDEAVQREMRITLSLAFLAPPIVRAAVEGRLPYGLTASSFSELPILWEEQLHLAS